MWSARLSGHGGLLKAVATCAAGERFLSTANHGGGNVSTNAAFAGTAGVYTTLTRRADDKYQLSERSGMRYVFDRIERQVDYAGNAMPTQYEPLGRLLQITETDGYMILKTSVDRSMALMKTHGC